MVKSGNEGLEPISSGTDEFEGGLVPVEQDPPEVAEARAAERLSQKQGAALGLSPEFIAQQAALSEKLKNMDPSDPNVEIIRAQAESMALMKAQLEALQTQMIQLQNKPDSPMLNDDNASVSGYPWQYYRLPKDWGDAERRNWIICQPGGASKTGHRDSGAYALYTGMGMTPITKYGLVDVPTQPNGSLQFIPMLSKGGAVEFPASQVIAYKWHVRPPIAGMKFPQYEAIREKVTRMTCEACGFRLYFMPTSKQAGNTYRAHLMQSHKYPFRDAAEAVARAGFTLAPFFDEGDEETPQQGRAMPATV